MQKLDLPHLSFVYYTYGGILCGFKRTALQLV